MYIYNEAAGECSYLWQQQHVPTFSNRITAGSALLLLLFLNRKKTAKYKESKICRKLEAHLLRWFTFKIIE